MYNRYVDGLDNWQSRDAGMYAQMGQQSGRAWLSEICTMMERLLLSEAGGNAVSLAQGESRSLTQMHWPITVKGPPTG
jgi:hypothetical protein